MRCVWVLLGVQTHIFTLHPYLRVLLMDFKNQLHENDFSFGAENIFFSSYSDGKVRIWVEKLAERGGKTSVSRPFFSKWGTVVVKFRMTR